MGSARRKKDFWDKISATTPLILGLAITGIGALFTQLYNHRQLELNKIEALDKLRPLLTSTKPEEREFAYASFRALGYEQIAIKMLQVTKDQSGRVVLAEIAKTASPEVKAEVSSTLKGLDEARKLVYKNEFGTAEPAAKVSASGRRDHRRERGLGKRHHEGTRHIISPRNINLGGYGDV